MPKTEMLINCVAGEECRIAIIRDGKLEELYQERASAESHVGNIYKGRVVNVEPSIQAAFLDFGLPRNGFLHISDLHPRYFPGKDNQDAERVGNKTRHRDRPPIQNCLQRGQEILVQIIKEGIGTKGPTLTSYLSIPGRYLVMMPAMESLGVSRKIDDHAVRRQMRMILDELNPPKEFGFIIRTAGLERTKAELKRDLAYLLRLWRTIEQRRQSNIRMGELYTESDLVIRTIRDVFSTDIERIVVDDPDAARRAQDYLAIASPRTGSKVFLYRDAMPLFERFGIEAQIHQMNLRKVDLPSGGSLIIDSTEALVAIDVNSGKMRDNPDAETTAYKTDMEAADELCRQLRLRDLGGVVVVDLIDMREAKHRRTVEQRFRQNLRQDRARTKVLSISQLGILEMTRQRMRPSLEKSLSVECIHCQGTGNVKSTESVVFEVLRRLTTLVHHEKIARVEVTISPVVAFQLLNRKRAELVGLEARYQSPVVVRVKDAGPIDFIELVAFDQRGGAIEPDLTAPMAEPDLVPAEQLSPSVPGPEAEPEQEDAAEPTAAEAAVPPAAEAGTKAGPSGRSGQRRRRRPRGGRRKKEARSAAARQTEPAGVASEPPPVTDPTARADAAGQPDPTAPSRDTSSASENVQQEPNAGATDSTPTKVRPPRKRGRRGGRRAKAAGSRASPEPAAGQDPATSRGYRNTVPPADEPAIATGNTADESESPT